MICRENPSGIDKLTGDLFDNIVSVCQKYAGYAVTPAEKHIMPNILKGYIRENKPLAGDSFVYSLCSDLGYSDEEIAPLKQMELWQDLAAVSQSIRSTKKIN
jgi:hypothetical protein